MNKEMIISSSDHDTRVAILEDDQVVEIFIEREKSRGVVGNIYKGRVSKVLPGMQSSFVDIGLERDAFLYVTEVVNTVEEFERLESGDEDADEPAPEPAAVAAGADPAETTAELTISPANGDAESPTTALSSVPAAPVPIGARATANGSAIASGPTPKSKTCSRKARKSWSRSSRNRSARRAPASRRMSRCQGASWSSCRRSITSASPARSTHAKSAAACAASSARSANSTALPVASSSGRPRPADRKRTSSATSRTSTRSGPKSARGWKGRRPPALLFQEQSLVTKLLRDLLTDDYTAIRIDNEQEHRRVVALIERIMPTLLTRVKRYSKDYPIFEEYGVQGEIDKALRSKVWLKSGGYLVINQTEALVAIDVNTGRYVGKRTGRLEDTIVKTNLEAVKEIVRQIRLRDLGGIIVLDLIDMEEKKNRQKVFQEVEKELRKDRSPSKAIQVSDFGLVIVTRKRVKQSLERQLTEPCPYCSGSGSIKSASTICFEIMTEIRKIGPELDGQGVILRVNPDIAKALKEEESALLRDLQRSLGKPITIKPDTHLHHEQFDVMASVKKRQVRSPKSKTQNVQNSVASALVVLFLSYGSR